MAESYGFSGGSSVFEGRHGPVTCSACGCRLHEEPGDAEARWFHFSPLGGRDARGCRVPCVELAHDATGQSVAIALA